MNALGFDFSASALWLAAALLLVIAEMILPGFFLIFLGVAAGVTGAIVLLAPGTPVIVQALLFAAVTAGAVAFGRRWYRRADLRSTDPMLNDRAARMVGSVVVAVEPVDGLQGRVKVGDGVWSAKGANAAIGERLRVTACEGNVLIVVRADP